MNVQLPIILADFKEFALGFLLFFISLFMIFIILIQRGKGGGLAGALTGTAQSAFGANAGTWTLFGTAKWTWISFPATRHNNGTGLSFADGHAESWRWIEKKTMETAAKPIPWLVLQPGQRGGDRDLQRLFNAIPQTIPVK